MINIQVAAIDESIALTNKQSQLALPKLKTKGYSNFDSNWSLEYSEQILCCYFNVTNFLQIVRSANIVNWYFEGIVFPGERILFEAMPNAQLEIYTCQAGRENFLDRITCNCLAVNVEKMF